VAADQLGQHGRSDAARQVLMQPTLDGARRLPQFVGVADRLGLLRYWRESKKAPDFCKATDPAPVCRTI
jgi:hypothetical protein